MALFKKKKNYIRIRPNRDETPTEGPFVPDDMWAKCPSCKHTLYTKEMGAKRFVQTVAIIFALRHGNDSP